MIYATDKDWLGSLYEPPDGYVYVMSEDGVYGAVCVPGSLFDDKGNSVEVPEGLVEIQKKHCGKRPICL